MQFRVPIDDEHTNHFVYDIYVAPDDIAIDPPPVVPHYEIPIFDEKGAPVLDYVLAQDMAAWWSQGPVVDRTREHLAGTDTAIVEFRAMLAEQIALVEAGKDPINTYRDVAECGEVIECSPKINQQRVHGPTWGGSRSALHKGYWRDDADRYGPLLKEVLDLMRRVDEAAVQPT
jgi:5,5'-dehydrodivanillate O-demethylase